MSHAARAWILAAATAAAVAGAGCSANTPAPEGSASKQAAPAPTLVKTDAEWRQILTPEEYSILVDGSTETAFTGKLWNNHAAGVYTCAASGAPLFSSQDKFDSGTGWPSVTRPIDPAAVVEVTDHSLGMTRTEVRDAATGFHLGHVFDDGPPPTGKRYCINSAALRFTPAAP
jgi:peptide-methionine (R)-S-oxide reductase